MGEKKNIAETELLDSLKKFKNYLNTDEDFKKFENSCNSINFFSILKIDRMEIRHSNMLAWLLDANESHNLGYAFIRPFVKKTIKDSEKFTDKKLDYKSFSVKREYADMDLFLISDENESLIVIENKVDSKEGKSQLSKYLNYCKEHYPDYKMLFIYLTPNGDKPSDSDNWVTQNYKTIYEILNDILKKNLDNKKIPDKAKVLIEDYIDTIGEIAMGNETINKITNDIKKHEKALNYLYLQGFYIEFFKNLFLEYVKEKAPDLNVKIEKTASDFIYLSAKNLNKYFDSDSSNNNVKFYYVIKFNTNANIQFWCECEDKDKERAAELEKFKKAKEKFDSTSSDTKRRIFGAQRINNTSTLSNNITDICSAKKAIVTIISELNHAERVFSELTEENN